MSTSPSPVRSLARAACGRPGAAFALLAAVVFTLRADASFTPSLTLTQQTYDACLASAASSQASITVTQGQTTLVGPTSDLSAVYAALASTTSAQALSVSSNAAGSAALGAAQACLSKAVPTLGAARLHEVRADLRCGSALLSEDQVHFNAVINPNLPWITFLPDGVSGPDCGQKRHILTYALTNGDLAGGYVTLNDDDDPETNVVEVTCNNNGQCDNAKTNICAPSDESQGLPIRCMCADVGPPNNGCFGSTTTKKKEHSGSCPDDLF
jgi:hypothetical protein